MKTVVVALWPLLVLAAVQARVTPAAVCDLKTSEFSKEHPLVLKPIEGGSKGHYEIDDPDSDDSLIFRSGQKVVFACPGSKFKNSENTLLNAECVNKKQFAKEVVCDLKTSEFSKEHPLVLKPIEGGSKGHYEIDDPDSDDSLIFRSGQKVVFACPGSKFKNSENTLLNAECVNKKQFAKEDGSNRQQSFESIKCNGTPKSVMKENGKCAGNRSAFEVGFETNEIFVKVMDICFDKDTNSAVYVKHKVSHNIDGSQKNFVRTPFKEDQLFADVDTANVYKKDYQERLFAEYVRAPDTVDEYVNKKQFLARGHLAPKADYVFGAQQTATFYYANTAPQWQSFNSGNWSKLEAAVRRLAVQRPRGLTVYTGTHGQYEIGGRPVYLARDSSSKRTMPVPLVFWKVVLDEETRTAVAFVGLNDPRGDPEKNAARDVCGPDVCDRVYWAPSFSVAPKSGLMYCCEVDKLRRKVNTFPSVGKVELLSE